MEKNLVQTKAGLVRWGCARGLCAGVVRRGCARGLCVGVVRKGCAHGVVCSGLSSSSFKPPS